MPTISPELSSMSPFDNSVKVPAATPVLEDGGRFARGWRRTYRAVGFKKAYSFVLFFIFAGAMLGFVLARLQYLAVGTKYAEGASPGEWYWYRNGHYRVGITMHLAACLPAGFLMIWQFIPWIRHHAMMFHRVNGYAITFLVTVSNIGALMIVRRSFGGALATQAAVGLLVIITSIGLFMAIYNIKRLQIDQHRAWMLRTMFALGTIITTRLVMVISAVVISQVGSYYTTGTCGEVQFTDGIDTATTLYPECFAPGATAARNVIVHANLSGVSATQAGSSLRVGFSTGLWVAIFLHLVGVEIYLKLTPREANRLRQISYERQKAAGFKHPGSAGLTVDRWGDADPWKPATDVEADASMEK